MAEDSDSGVNGDISFSVVYRNFESKLFDIRKLGNGNQAELFTLVEFHRERPESDAINIGGEVKYRVTVKAEDNGTPKLSTNCFFFVTIGDINNNAPQFDDNPYKSYMLRTVNVNSRVVRVFAIDDDEGDNARVDYSLQNAADCTGCFSINSDGWILRSNGGIGSNVSNNHQSFHICSKIRLFVPCLMSYFINLCRWTS